MGEPLSRRMRPPVAGSASTKTGFGFRAFVGVGSVVTRSLPANAIAGGNPARVIGSSEPGVLVVSEYGRRHVCARPEDGVGLLAS